MFAHLAAAHLASLPPTHPDPLKQLTCCPRAGVLVLGEAHAVRGRWKCISDAGCFPRESRQAPGRSLWHTGTPPERAARPRRCSRPRAPERPPLTAATAPRRLLLTPRLCAC